MKLFIGIITYEEQTAKYLPAFLDSLEKQSHKDFELMVFDNSKEEINENTKVLSQRSIKVKRTGENIGFARAYNILISDAHRQGGEYFLVINTDIIMEPQAIEKMIKIIKNNDQLGSVCPKIRVWDFENNNKTNLIDSCGIAEISALRFKDVGQGENDAGQYDKADILGPSGAAGLYRISALEKVKDQFGYFDDRMFMYEEDCDLAYRLKNTGFFSRLVPEAIVYHDRTTKAKGTSNISVALNRKNKSRQVRIWAFKNKHLIFLKHWKKLNLKQKAEVLLFAFKMFAYALMFERFLLKEYRQVYESSKKTKNN